MPEKLSSEMDKLEIEKGKGRGSDQRPAKRQDLECKDGETGGGAGSKLSTGVSPLKKPKAAQPPSCQVEKCEADLGSAKEYYRRHRVCEVHSKARNVLVLGEQQRFCQQCSRFHVLVEFDEAKRSCRRRLAGHNERRRKTPSDSSVDRSDANNHHGESWRRHMEESGGMAMLLERDSTAKVCKEKKSLDSGRALSPLSSLRLGLCTQHQSFSP